MRHGALISKDLGDGGGLTGSLADAIASLASGGLAILVDEQGSRGDLVAVARTVSADAINSMAVDAGGLIAVAITPGRRDQLGLRPMPGTRFPATVEAASGVTTGISAADRALTIRVVADAAAGPDALVSPGHVVPLVAAPDGLLARWGRLEAAIDLADLADSPAAAICEVLDHDGRLADIPSMLALAERSGTPLTTISEVVDRRAELF
jgi:3,4-dihydroxy 2-butanone 4-phosphate synthase/GTP cyclohydrolase II